MAGWGRISGGDYIQIPWVRNPMKRLYPGIFSFHFRNLIYANGRNSSYLCFEVAGVQYYSSRTVSFHRGVFRNQVYENKSYHAELCFLSWFKANKLSPGEHYHVTWFLSWSPCARCAEEIANFLKQHRNVTLRVFAARLYYYWNPAFQQGLRKLRCLGAQILTTVGKTSCTTGTCVSGVGRKCIEIIMLCPHGLRKSSAAEMVSLCQTRGDNFRVKRKIQEFVLQKNVSRLQPAADAQESDTKRYLRLKKQTSLSGFSETPPSLLPSCIKTPYFCFLGKTDLRDVVLSSSLWPNPINLFLSPSTSVSVLWLTSASGTQTGILGGDSVTTQIGGL